ncbi:MAG: succinate dehydrogenase, cytochrome b556 subunit [Actinomycetota bacterium]|nr:succinate dehydrogenase, cytochrome b556 subunit [Actinomycetota bacterium]
MNTAQVVFAIALGLVSLVIVAFAGYVLSSAAWGDRWARHREPAAVAEPPGATGMSSRSRVYRGRSGQWAFMTHRITGFLVFAFLLLHIVDVSLIARPELYDQVHELYGNVMLRLFEVGLLFALVYHSLNGLRIVMIDFFPGSIKNEKAVLVAVTVLSVGTTLAGGYVIMKPFIEGRLL